MIKSIEVSKLFGRFNYKIELCSEGVTIITGPNGYGKSTFLKIIDALSNGRIAFFEKLDFSSLNIVFDNSQAVKLEKTDTHIIIGGVKCPRFTNDQLMRYSQRQLPLRKGPHGWLDMQTDTLLSDDEGYLQCKDAIYSRLSLGETRYFGDMTNFNLDEKDIQALNAKIVEIKNLTGEIRLISDQRLIKKSKRHNDTATEVIDELPRRLKSTISSVSEEYSRVANKLDGSYPKRLFTAKEGLKDKAEYETRLKEANQKFEMLSKYYLVDMSFINEGNYDKQHNTALKIYFDDFSEKYKVFENLIEKFEMFTKIINERLSFKQIRISPNKGFEVIDSEDQNKFLSLNQLSSGEKHEIVLFYNLIFETKSDLLLLIDEPEISLHITWQENFLNDLLEVSKNIGLQAIVATHSPQIISNHWDIQIDLGSLYGKQFN